MDGQNRHSREGGGGGQRKRYMGGEISMDGARGRVDGEREREKEDFVCFFAFILCRTRCGPVC